MRIFTLLFIILIGTICTNNKQKEIQSETESKSIVPDLKTEFKTFKIEF